MNTLNSSEELQKSYEQTFGIADVWSPGLEERSFDEWKELNKYIPSDVLDVLLANNSAEMHDIYVEKGSGSLGIVGILGRPEMIENNDGTSREWQAVAMIEATFIPGSREFGDDRIEWKFRGEYLIEYFLGMPKFLQSLN